MDTQNNTQMEALDRYVDERIKQAITVDRAAQAEAQKAKENEPSALDRYIDSLEAKQAKEAADRKRLRDYYGLNDGE